jgi:hypothetical protein
MWFGDAGFEPGGQILEMNAPAAVSGGVVVIPVLIFANASVDETEMCAIVFRRQFKGNRGDAWREGFPGIAEAMRQFENEDLAKVEHVRPQSNLIAPPGRKSTSAFFRNQRSRSSFSVRAWKTRSGVALMKSSFSIERPIRFVFSMIHVQSFLISHFGQSTKHVKPGNPEG